MASVQVDLDSCYFRPAMISLTGRLVNKVQSVQSKVSFKYIIQTYLLADNKHQILNQPRRYWGAEKGWKGTLMVLLAICQLACRTREGKDQWNDLILPEVRK